MMLEQCSNHARLSASFMALWVMMLTGNAAYGACAGEQLVTYDQRIRIKGSLIAHWWPDVYGGSGPLTCTVVEPPSHGTVQFPPDCRPPEGYSVYKPNPGYAGPDKFTYQVTDGCMTSRPAATVNVDYLAPCVGPGCYTLREIFPPNTVQYSFAEDLNDQGQVVGRYVVPTGGETFFWDSATGELATFSIVNVTNVIGINNNQQIVGIRFRGNNDYEAFMFDRPTGALLLFGGTAGSRPYGINNFGQVVGASGPALFTLPHNFHAFLWNPVNQIKIDLGTLNAGDQISTAFAINDVGQVVGASSPDSDQGINPVCVGSQRAFFWQAQTGMVPLETDTSGTLCSSAVAINARGQVVGTLRYVPFQSQEFEAFLWDPETRMLTGLGSLGSIYPGSFPSAYSSAIDLNDAGQVIGRSSSAYAYDGNPFLWDATNGMLPVFHLLDESANGWSQVSVVAINNNGQIIGSGTSPAGQRFSAFLLTPVPGGPFDPCRATHPVTQIVLDGSGQGATVNATLKETFTGNITGYTSTSVTICNGTLLNYEATSTMGDAICTTNSSPGASLGTLAPGDKLICTNKPTGQDTDRFRILGQ